MSKYDDSIQMEPKISNENIIKIFAFLYGLHIR